MKVIIRHYRFFIFYMEKVDPDDLNKTYFAYKVLRFKKREPKRNPKSRRGKAYEAFKKERDTFYTHGFGLRDINKEENKRLRDLLLLNGHRNYKFMLLNRKTQFNLDTMPVESLTYNLFIQKIIEARLKNELEVKVIK